MHVHKERQNYVQGGVWDINHLIHTKLHHHANEHHGANYKTNTIWSCNMKSFY